MKVAILFSVLALSVSSAQATETLAATSLAPSISTFCLADQSSRCRIVIEAGNEAKAFLIDSTAEVGPRLQKAMDLVRAQNPEAELSNQELAQAVWEFAQQYQE